jgi:hypothetical protein
VRQHHGAAHHLIGVAGVDAEAHGDLDRLVELGVGGALQGLDGLAQPVGAGPPPWRRRCGSSFRAWPWLSPPRGPSSAPCPR